MYLNSSKSSLVQFSENYAQIHGRIVFPLTIFGILISIVTIIILHRKNFRTPTNLILQHVAFFDTIVLISFNIYSLYFYLLHQPNPFVGQSKFWPCFALFHSNIGITAHSIALWLTCLLAIVRIIEIEVKSLLEYSLDSIYNHIKTETSYSKFYTCDNSYLDRCWYSMFISHTELFHMECCSSTSIYVFS